MKSCDWLVEDDADGVKVKKCLTPPGSREQLSRRGSCHVVNTNDER